MININGVNNSLSSKKHIVLLGIQNLEDEKQLYEFAKDQMSENSLIDLQLIVCSKDYQVGIEDLRKTCFKYNVEKGITIN